jgi:hypothetical protein
LTSCLFDTPILHPHSRSVLDHCHISCSSEGEMIPRWATKPYLLIWRLLIDDICPMFPQFESQHSTLLRKEIPLGEVYRVFHITSSKVIFFQQSFQFRREFVHRFISYSMVFGRLQRDRVESRNW